MLMFIGGGQDYDSGPHTATITTGSDRTSLSIPVNDDDIVEGNEDFVVFIEMSSLPNGFVLGAVSQATVTVRDEDSKLAIDDVSYNHYHYMLLNLMYAWLCILPGI